MSETSEATRRENILRDKIRQMDRDLIHARSSNQRLVETLKTCRDELSRLKSAVESPEGTTLNYATVVAVCPPGTAGEQGRSTATSRASGVDVFFQGKKTRLHVSPLIDLSLLHPGDEVLIDEEMQIVGAYPPVSQGHVSTIKEVVGDTELLVASASNSERLVRISPVLEGQSLRVGDGVVVDERLHLAVRRLDRSEVQDLIIEQIPDVTYEDIGGLGAQIEEMRDAIELPLLHPEEFRKFGLTPPQGILLFGPPGCGKTLIAQAVAHSLAERSETPSYFFNIKGPELLDKYVGETEKHIRTIFARARERAADGYPVIVFFDEMDSLFRTRGSGRSSDVETTIVPQLLAEIDGVERLDNVIVIGATNREDMIDPAIMRPGRLDVKIRIRRPDAEGSAQILGKYLTPELPFGPGENAETMIDRAVEEIFDSAEHNALFNLSLGRGEERTLYFSDFISGAVLRNIVDRAKKLAIKDSLAGKGQGLLMEHMSLAIAQERKEQAELQGASNPQEWAQITGRHHDEILSLTPLPGEGDSDLLPRQEL